MDSIALNDGLMYYAVEGEGMPLLLVHAGVADSRMWEPQVEPLARRFRVITCDLRGYGRSPLPDGPFAYHDDLKSLLAHLAIRQVWLVGASFGARVVVDFALANPERVTGLVLVSPIVSGFESTEELDAFSEREEALLEAGDLEGATRLNVETWIDGPSRAPGEVDATIRALVTEMQRNIFAQPEPPNVSLRDLDPPARERLGEIRAPVLVVGGDLDLASFRGYTQAVAEQVPDSHLEILHGTAHLPCLEDRARFNRLVTEFIDGSEGRSNTPPSGSTYPNGPDG